MRRGRLLGISVLAAVAAFGTSACTDDDREDIGETVDSIVEDVGDAAESVASNVGDAAGDVVDDAAELAARNLAADAGEDAFDEAGYPINDEGLACEATVTEDATALDVSCTGTTEDGSEAALTGQTTELPGASLTELEGAFTGTVDGGEVFTTDNLGG